jgi:AbrB family looped-hinge helix DNA binding protein
MLEIVQPIGTLAMTIIRIRERAQITLPAEVRKALNVEKGDYLEAEVVEGSLMLKPVALVDRKAAKARLNELLRGSRYVGPAPEPSEDEVMEEAVQAVKETRRELAQERRARSSR